MTRTRAYLEIIRNGKRAAALASTDMEAHKYMVQAYEIGIEMAGDYCTIECKDLVRYIVLEVGSDVAVSSDDHVAVCDFLMIKTLSNLHQYLLSTFLDCYVDDHDGMGEDIVNYMLHILAKALRNRNFYIRGRARPVLTIRHF